MIDSLTRLLELMTQHGAYRTYAKRLSPNDNSKNQVYLGGGFSALNIIPHGEIYVDTTSRGGSKQDRPKAAVRFFWIDENGKHLAPAANLILYPDYPEVRMSGFLLGCQAAPNGLMTIRDEGRILFLGVTREGEILGFVTDGASPISNQLNAYAWPTLGVFLELPLSLGEPTEPKAILLAHLRRIHDLKWIASQKLTRTGAKVPYAARNGGGYSLEAELGIQPNGHAEPDFMGWEVKQYGVRDFTKFAPKSAVTLFTPEPTGGFYRTGSAERFVERFGYVDKSGKPGRINFGGIYSCLKAAHADTGLRMTLNGFDAGTGKITDMNGGLALISTDGEEAATWSFSGLMAHWNRKHAQAAYVPSLFRTPPPEYSYGSQVLLCEQTDFILFLEAFAAGKVYYDPALKLEKNASGKQVFKKRSQFRVQHSNLTQMYHRHEIINLAA
ncbi:MvaI/BcnI family restriction endonuclease [Brevundimonas sp.]|uniref:MvaI/BcnI family restriction endonuclease n=1 Tax=Brevundimonas sp. TaxID=1871086 RepID=UPI003A93668D